VQVHASPTSIFVLVLVLVLDYRVFDYENEDNVVAAPAASCSFEFIRGFLPHGRGFERVLICGNGCRAENIYPGTCHFRENIGDVARIQPLPLAPSPADGEGGTGGEGGARAGPLPLPPLHRMERGSGGEVRQLLYLSAVPPTRQEIWLRLRRSGDSAAYPSESAPLGQPALR